MKKLYTIGIGLSIALMASPAFAQVNKKPGNDNLMTKKTIGIDSGVKVETNIRKDDPAVYWTEDFSNGFDGQNDNGAWTTGLDQGNLWFYTFPAGLPNAYDRTLPLDNPAYNNTLPLFYGTQQLMMSETRDNGIMMLDVDRYNSDATDPGDVGSEHNLENSVQAALISPVIDLSSAAANIVITFSQKLRMNGLTASATVEVSTNGGSTWVPFELNPDNVSNTIIQAPVSINISEVLATASTDLSECKIRFVWNLDATVYYWQLDDIALSELPLNDLKIGKTYYNDYELKRADPTASSIDYYKAFEYNNQPDYLTRPFTFGAIVSNIGADTQTGVTLHVNATLPDGSLVEDYSVSEPIDMEPGAVDTIFIADSVMPDVDVAGTYTFNYVVTQDDEDGVPDNNIGMTQTVTLTRDIQNDGFAIASNDARISGPTKYSDVGQDIIWGVPYVFPEATDGNPKYITHVEAVLYSTPGFAETLPGETIFFNVRKGSAFDENTADPATLTSVVFDAEKPYKYDAVEIEHVIADDELWHTDVSNDPVWLSFELPSPVLVDANTFYQAEFRVQASGDEILFPALTKEQEYGAGLWFNNGASATEWTLGGSSATQLWNGLAIRFRTSADPTLVEKISQENGMQLVQNYPNPFTTSTMIQYRLEETTQASLEVRDVTGKLVFNKDLGMVVGATANTYILQRGSLTPGLYTYSIVTSANTITRKLIVQ